MIRRLANHLLVLFKDILIRHGMRRTSYRTNLLLTFDTGVGQRRTRILIECILVLSLQMAPHTILRRRNLTGHRFQVNIVRNNTQGLTNQHNQVDSVRIRSLLRVQGMYIKSYNQGLHRALVTVLMVRQRINRLVTRPLSQAHVRTH